MIEGKQLKVIISNASSINPRVYMMASKAYHCLGDISRSKEDLCIIYKQTHEYYIGNWVTGYGFIDVLFPKETTRPLTSEEIEKHNASYIQVGSQPPVKLNINENNTRKPD